jgi:hypothetical protein
MRISLALAFALIAATPAFAADKPGDPGTNVEMPFLIAPMSRDGRLLGYAYISPKLVASTQAAANDIRDKIVFIQDAFVRDVNGAPVSQQADPTAVDRALLASRLIADARKVVGTMKVAVVTFGDGKKDLGITFSPLHPTQTPQPAAETAAAPPPTPPAASQRP